MMNQKITVKIPTRVDFAGGTVDLWPLYTLGEKAATVNAGISIYQTVTLTTRGDSTGEFEFVSQDLNQSMTRTYSELAGSTELPLLCQLANFFWSESLPSVTLTTSCESPAGAGLGGSSCLSVAVASAFEWMRARVTGQEFRLDEATLVTAVQNIEARVIHAPTGCQDYWGGLRAGLNVIDFSKSRVDVHTYKNPDFFKEIKSRMSVLFCGKRRDSAMNNWQIFRRIYDGDRDFTEKVIALGEIGWNAGECVRQGDVLGLIDLSARDWEVRKSLWPGVETVETQKIDAAVKNAGARFSKVCGAGGGGVMIAFSDPEDKRGVEKAAANVGAEVMASTIVGSGLTIEAENEAFSVSSMVGLEYSDGMGL